MHYYKFNIADWHLDTSHLSLEEEAIYFKLINFYYDSEKPIPEETQTVIRRLRLLSHTDTVGLVLKEFFVLEGDGWHHKRCDDELAKYHLKSEKNREIGKLGGRPRKIKDLETNPKETQTVKSGNPNKTLTTNHKPLTTIDTPEGVDPAVFQQYLAVRKAKKATVWSALTLLGIQREATKAGISLQEAMTVCVERNWITFKSDWDWKSSAKPQAQNLGTWK